MSETTKPARTIEQVQQEFNQACLRAGHLEYTIYTNKKDLELLNQTIRNLNFEAASIQAANQKAAAEAAAPAPAPTLAAVPDAPSENS